MRRPWAVAVVVALAGIAATVAAAVSMSLPAGDATGLIGLSVLGAAVAGIIGAALLRSLRRASVGTQAVVVAFVSVGAVAVGVVTSSLAMYVSHHDLSVLLVVMLSAGTVGVLTALALGQRVGEASRTVAELTHRIAQGGRPDLSMPPDTGELASLAHRLDEMSAQLEDTRARERAMEASRRELVAWVSHDLRTPLAGIRAMVEALEDGVVDDPGTVARYHRTIRQEADRLAGLIDDLFELSRIQAGALTLELEPVALADLVSDAVAGALPLARARQVELQGSLHGAAPVVDLSTPEMARVIRNLLDNAIRHTSEHRTIRVEIDSEGAWALVSVVDACGGIPPDELGRVFDLAFRGDAARTPEQRGRAGLGLAIAKGFVEAHRGTIHVRNEGPGCRFTVRLPLHVPSRT